MSSSNLSVKCNCGAEFTSINPDQCYHGLKLFCRQCLIRHHHNDVKGEFMNMIKRIDEILAQFLHHAHNQTEWTEHLIEDHSSLTPYIYQTCFLLLFSLFVFTS